MGNQEVHMPKWIFVFTLMMVTHLVQAQDLIEVSSDKVTLEKVYETMGRGARKVLLKLSSNTPKEFVIKFDYKYHFRSQELDSVIITPGGIGGYTTRTTTEDFEGSETLKFDVSESTLDRGDEIEMMVVISKPNQNTHSIKVEATLLDPKGNTIKGGRVLFGLLGRSYKISAECSELSER